MNCPAATDPDLLVTRPRIGWLIAIVACTALSPRSSNAVAASPWLTASINESRLPVLSHGWPLLLEVDLLHPTLFDTNAAPLLISSGTGSWAQSLQVSVLDGRGQAQTWPLHLYGSSSNSITLDADHAGQLLYYLAPPETATIPAGNYTVGVSLSVTNPPDTNAWQGQVSSVPVQLTLNDESVPLNDADTERKQKLLASYHLLMSQPQQANADIDQLLSVQPTNIDALVFKSYLVRVSNQPLQAESLLSAAIEQFYSAFPDSQEPPLDMLRQRGQLWHILANSLVAQAVVAGNQLTLIWNSTPGQTYVIETSSDLQTWSAVGTNVTASSAATTWMSSVGSRAAFFRVRQ
jgi:hypothetical protein